MRDQLLGVRGPWSTVELEGSYVRKAGARNILLLQMVYSQWMVCANS